ncbi:MAG: O-antigen ligase family protein [Candidatus Uhrbacteria bacterium]|nr:O-antigen ligase family protein [Candidatus Uhrbacteria bacterium]
MTRQKIANGFLMAALFLLPWQTILLYRLIALPEGATVYGNLGVYVTEILIAIAFFVRGRPLANPVFLKIIRALFVFFAACFLSLTYSHTFAVSLGWLSHFVAGGMLFLLLLDDRTNIPQTVHVFLAGLILPCILGWMQYITGFSPALTVLGLAQKHVETSGVAVVATDAFRSLRAYGPFPHPNIFGGYLAVAILLKGWKGRTGLKSLKGWRGWVQIAMIALFTSTLILTFSRGAWLALTIGLVVFLGQALFYKKLVPHRAIPLLSIGLLTILLSIGMLQSHVLARFNPALHVEAISLEERASQYQTFPSVFKIDPLFGVGPGAYVFALESLSKGEPAWSYQPIHNAFLLLIAELGVVAFLAFGYFLFEIGRLMAKYRKTTGGIFAATLLLELLVLSLFDHYLFSMWSGIALTTVVFAISLRLAIES